jgi:hypothetical protein
MKKFLKWVPWVTVLLAWAVFAAIMIVSVRGKVWTDWAVGIPMVFGVVCGITWSLRQFGEKV